MGSPRTSDGKPIFSSWPTEASRTTEYTHNWCDKTTWYDKSIRVVDEAPTMSGNTLIPLLGPNIATLSHTYVIDTCHGKLTNEDIFVDENNFSYRVQVKVNGVIKAEVDPHTGTGDYTVDYKLGKITFSSRLNSNGNDVVLVTYHYATTSVWVLSPSPNKKLGIKRVEVQFSADVILKDTVVFQAYGLASVFAPQLGYPAGTKIPIGNPNKYKSFRDFINESNGNLPTMPSIGGSNWRGLTQSILTLPWDYLSLLELSSSQGVEIRISLEHDAAFDGELCVATFYCYSLDE